MSDTFSFKAARPAGAHAPLKGQTASDATQGPPGPDVVHDPDGHPVGPTRRKRRMRAEINAGVAAGVLGQPAETTGDKNLAVLVACLKQLRSLSTADAQRAIEIMRVLFK